MEIKQSTIKTYMRQKEILQIAKAIVVDSLNSLGCFLTAIDKRTPMINKIAFKAPKVAKNAVW